MSNSEHRLTVLEQHFQVMQKEINEVLNEVTQATAALMRGNKAALVSLQAQIDDLREYVDFVENADEIAIREGKEI